MNETASVNDRSNKMKRAAISSILLIMATWIYGCQNNSDRELAQAKAEAEAARGQLAQLRAAPPPPKPPVQAKVSGELFATTKGGDVKKGAGVKVYLIPISSVERELVADAHGRFTALQTAYTRFTEDLDKKYPRRNEFSSKSTSFERDEIDAQEAAYYAELDEYLVKHYRHRYERLAKGLDSLLARGQATTTNSDGRFEFQMRNGEYLLLTEQKSFAKEKLRWFSRVDVRGQDVILSLDQNSAIIGESLAILSPDLDASDVRFSHIINVIQPIIAADLGERVKESKQREADSLAQAIAADPVRDARTAQEVIPQASVSSFPEIPSEISNTFSEDEKRMQIIFRDWAKQRGVALKRASKMSKSASETYMRRIDQGLVKSLTKKYGITHEELDHIEAFGAKNDWWERE